MSEFNLDEERENTPAVIPAQAAMLPQPVGKKYEYEKILNANAEQIIADVVEGKSFREIAMYYNVPLYNFFQWRKNSKHSAQIEAALTQSAEEDVRKAEEILLEVKYTDSIATVMARKELSQFYRWKAAMRDSKRFGKNVGEETAKLPEGNTTASQFDAIVNKVIEATQQNTIDITHVDVTNVPSSEQQI